MQQTTRCRDYGFECDFVIDGQMNNSKIDILKNHFDEEHGIDYTKEAVIQMMVNRGHSQESLEK